MCNFSYWILILAICHTAYAKNYSQSSFDELKFHLDGWELATEKWPKISDPLERTFFFNDDLEFDSLNVRLNFNQSIFEKIRPIKDDTKIRITFEVSSFSLTKPFSNFCFSDLDHCETI